MWCVLVLLLIAAAAARGDFQERGELPFKPLSKLKSKLCNLKHLTEKNLCLTKSCLHNKAQTFVKEFTKLMKIDTVVKKEFNQLDLSRSEVEARCV